MSQTRTPKAQLDTTLVDTTSSQVLTTKDLTSGTNTFPTLNQNTTGSAAKWTTARNLAGNSVDGSANVAFANKFIVQGTADTGLSAAQFLGALGTGIVKNTTTTGVLSIAASGTDYAPATSGSSYLIGNGSGGFTNATSTGSGNNVLTTSPTITTPVLTGVPTGTAIDSLLPWLVDVNVFMTPISQVNFNSILKDVAAINNGFINGSGAQNNEINWDVVLSAGTWTFEVLYTKAPDAGIMNVQFDGVSAGTIDSYNASNAYNTRSSLTGITVAATGKKRLKILLATKNASSSAYNAYLQHIQLRRTA